MSIIIRVRSVSQDGSHHTMWGRLRVFKVGSIENRITNAIKHAINTMNTKHIGMIVYAGDQPIYHAKWGNDGRPFHGWKQSPVAEYWRRRIARR